MKNEKEINQLLILVSSVELIKKPKKYIRGFKKPILIFTSNKQIK